MLAAEGREEMMSLKIGILNRRRSEGEELKADCIRNQGYGLQAILHKLGVRKRGEEFRTRSLHKQRVKGRESSQERIQS